MIFGQAYIYTDNTGLMFAKALKIKKTETYNSQIMVIIYSF